MTDLEASIEQYQAQLKQVEEALLAAKDAKESESLRSLKSDLEELIDLTTQTLNQNADSPGPSTSNFNSNSNSIDDEMALFMSEIKSMESTPNAAVSALETDTDEQFEAKMRAIKEELQAMIGKKCSAPHNHSWGARAYHNAIVCGVDDTHEYDIADITSFRLRILFTNPTHREMIPCGYFLDGNCRFDEEKCRFSHGELISFGELRDYKEPEFDKLQRNCVVLAKMQDKMWHKGKVVCANFVEKTCRVRLDQQKKDADFNFEDLFPIFQDEDASTGDSSSSDSDGEESDDVKDLQNAYLIEKALLTPAIDRPLGEWEKHTRGIGSRLMQKMGYITGCGLGSLGEGIVVPISAQILPPGRSLDHCMELREAANGDKNLFSVERKLQAAKKKQEAINAKVYEREKQKTDVFSFLNDSIFSATGSTSKSNVKSDKLAQTSNYKNHTMKNLNVESLKIGDDIRRKEREILKLKESMKRHSSDSEIFKKMQGQMAVKNQELGNLKRSESCVAREQMTRKHKDKISIF